MTTAVADSDVTIEKKGTYITGHCRNEVHQNMKKLSPGGALLPSCRGTYEYKFVTITCWCWCHELYRMLAPEVVEALSAPSIHPTPVTTGGNGLHVPSQHVPSGVDGSPDDRKDFYKRFLNDGDIRNNLEPQVIRFIHKFVLEDDDARVVTKDGPSGSRRPRGSLDYNVEVVCRMHIDMYLPGAQLTPQDIANFINALEPPSQGAIHAVLTRWQEAGYCHMEKNPVRFAGFTGDAMKYGIAHMKKRTASNARARAQGFF